MDNTQAMLKELSNLSKNLDVLVQELKTTNRVVKTNSEDIKKLSEEKKESIKTEDNKEEPFKNALRFFSDSIKETFKEQILSQEGIINLLQRNLTSQGSEETKPKQQMPDYRDFLKSALSGITKLENGGEITKSGVAIVGEKGPELVQLKAGSVVNNNEELLKMVMEEESKRKQSFDSLSQEYKKSNEASVITGKPELEGFVTNSLGVKVPKSEIEAYKKEIYEEFKSDFDADPSMMDDEVKIFVDNYRESFSVEDIQKLSAKAETAKPAESTPSTQSGEQARIEKTREERQKKIEEKEKLSSIIGSKIPSKVENFLEKKSEIFTKLGILEEPEKPSPASLNEVSSGLQANEVSSGLQALTERLKRDNPNVEFTQETQSLKSRESKPATSPAPQTSEDKQIISSSTSSQMPTTSEPAKKETKISNSGESVSGINQQDVKDIKALLTGIYRQLSGPLNIANDSPFRPNSNVL